MSYHHRLHCPNCDATVRPSQLRDPSTCPHCGGELEPLPNPNLCEHQWRKEGVDEDGVPSLRCVRCGETEGVR